MTRLALIPAALFATPAFAHSSNDLHVHQTDGVTLLLGLSMIGVGAGAAALARARKK